jgi:hypothetical protein
MDHGLANSTQPVPWDCEFSGCNTRFVKKSNATLHRKKHEDCLTCKNSILSIKKDTIAKQKKMCASGKIMLDRWAASDRRKAGEGGGGSDIDEQEHNVRKRTV